ncbi:MAG: antitoxin [Acidimicrobiales bacterium]|nr:antitoxin [Acidimicrobiales bacterium]MYD33186.1 antitoxin [Acidimicrobiales bacterium]MYI10084.1 antitoxin [Acidimicrobiales bacterium]
MSKRLQVLVPEGEYAEIQETARRCRLTVAEWVRQTMREALGNMSPPADPDAAKLRAIAEASQHEFPTADIDGMLLDIEAGRVAP